MDAPQIADHAQRLFAAYGDKAEFEAAQKAQHADFLGKTEEAEDWRKIRAAIRGLRGPSQS